MKFSCLQENLYQGLSIVSRLAGTSKTSLPILNNILLTTQKGILKISSTNLEIAIETKIRAKIEDDGKITLPAQLFNNYISLLPNEILNFDLNKDELSIKSEKQKTKIKGISAEDFPIIPQIEKKEKIVVESQELKNAIEKIIFAISPSEIRIELSGALFSFNTPKQKRLTIVGTDSYRLAEKEIELKESNLKEEKNIIIPIKTLQEVLRIIKNEGEVEIYLSESQILFIYQNTELISRIIAGEYPNYKQTIPELCKTKIIINKEEFLRAIKIASLFTKLGINDINLGFSAKEGQITISSLNNQLGENKTTLTAEITGQNNEIVFNYRYLIDGLTNLPDGELILEIVNDNTPGLIKSTGDQLYLYLIMPIKNN
jgi:DNA polymerase-3 subunit beta